MGVCLCALFANVLNGVWLISLPLTYFPTPDTSRGGPPLYVRGC